MAYVVCEPCRVCRYTDCVVVCPTESFYDDGRMVVIDPDSCVDCDACAPECPVEAIYQEASVPTPWTAFIELNRERSAALKAQGGPVIERLQPLLGPGCRGPKA